MSTKKTMSGLGTKVTAIIVSWKRPKEVGEIVTHLQQYDFIDEIIIAVNKPDDNKKCYRRWLTALNAKNDTVYVQDDDCIVNNLDKLYQEYTGKEMLIGLKGTRLMEYVGSKTTMVGWGSFFDKSWVDFSKYIEKYGEDDILIRESDRIMTYKIGCERPHNYQPSDIVDYDSCEGEMAMARESDHYQKKEESIKRAKEIYD